MPVSQDSVEQQCRQVVGTIIRSNDWQLLTEDQLVQQVQAQIAALNTKPTESAIYQVLMKTYSREWHRACLEGEPRQQRSLEEIRKYAFRFAKKRGWDETFAEEVANTAAINAWQKVQNGKVEHPEAFINFLMFEVLGAIKTTKSELATNTVLIALESPEDERDDVSGDLIAKKSSLEQSMLCQEHQEKLLKEIKRLSEKRPKARDQIHAVIYKFLYGFSDEEIAVQLGKTADQIHVLRSRGLDIFRQEPIFWNYLETFLPTVEVKEINVIWLF